MKLNRKMVWTAEEIELLKQLREKYDKNSWQMIAHDINSMINNSTKKTGRQCREKYLNTCKFNEENKLDNVWVKQDERKLYQLYLKYGSCWTNFQPAFPNKSLNCIKNKFYCKIRKLCRDLMKFQKEHLKNCRAPITFNNILGILDLGAGLRAWMAQNNFIANEQCKIMINCNKILRKAFVEENEYDQEFLREIVSDFKEFNFKLKSLGIYKCDVRKTWKLSERSLNFILRAYNIIINQQQLSNSEEQKTQNQNTPTQNTESFISTKEDDLMMLDVEEQHKFMTYKSYDEEFFNQYQAIVDEEDAGNHVIDWYDHF